MAISSSERRNWTTPGAKANAEATYTSVKNALSSSPRMQPFTYEVFLQGSYANATNIRGDSDVDIVAMVTSTYSPNLARLGSAEKATYEQRRVPAQRTIADFRNAVHGALVDYYTSRRVHSKNKCIRVDGQDSYVDADIVPALQHRIYTSYPRLGEPRYIEGIEIRPVNGEPIVNFPKQHIDNGQKKNQRSNERYKKTVRQVKRLANRAADLGKFSRGAVPGYVLECMTYNVPDGDFTHEDSDRLVTVMWRLHVQDASDYYARFMSCDEIHYLFQDDPGDHNASTAKRVIEGMWEVL